MVEESSFFLAGYLIAEECDSNTADSLDLLYNHQQLQRHTDHLRIRETREPRTTNLMHTNHGLGSARKQRPIPLW